MISNVSVGNDDSQNSFKEALIYENIDLGLLKEFVDQALPQVIAEMKRRHPDTEYDEDTLKQDAMNVIHKHIQDTLEVKHVQIPDKCDDCLQYDE